MNNNDYAELDAVGLSAAIKHGDVSAQEVTEKSIEILDQLNPTLNVAVMTNFDNARRVSSAELPNTPVSGAPFLLKDVNQYSHDMPTTFSSKYFEDAKPKPDSELVARWRKAVEVPGIYQGLLATSQIRQCFCSILPP